MLIQHRSSVYFYIHACSWHAADWLSHGAYLCM